MMPICGRAAMLFLAVSLFSGCGESGPPIPPSKPVEYNSTNDLKSRLDEIARTGVGGSATMGMKESIEKMIRPANAVLADDLKKDLDQLARSTEMDEVKAIAARMVGKL